MSEEPRVVIFDAIIFLEKMANKLDGWAQQSQSGGWSTHQVGVNIEAANDCRRMASRLISAHT